MMLFAELKKKHISYSVVRFEVLSLGECRPKYHELADLACETADELIILGFHRKRAARNRTSGRYAIWKCDRISPTPYPELIPASTPVRTVDN